MVIFLILWLLKFIFQEGKVMLSKHGFVIGVPTDEDLSKPAV